MVSGTRPLENARKKLEKKQLDLIVANDITDADSGFGADTNKVTMIDRDGKVEISLAHGAQIANRDPAPGAVI